MYLYIMYKSLTTVMDIYRRNV